MLHTQEDGYVSKDNARIRHGFMEIVWGEAARGCAMGRVMMPGTNRPQCREVIKPGDRALIDMEGGPEANVIFCQYCGPTERYARKKAEQRGDRKPQIGDTFRNEEITRP